jgi:hypothetical protein
LDNKYWAIRHKPTGFFMPEPKMYHKRGSSFWEPKEQADRVRIFYTEKAAKSALGQWLRGEHHPEFEYDEGHMYAIGAKVKPVSTRNRDDMEIVMMVLTEVTD